MEKKSFLDGLARYRVKIERDGKSVADLPGILCLPGLLAAPRLSIAGIIAAPLLGYSIRLENEDGKAVDVENAVRKTAETVMETASGTARAIREEIDKAWKAASADDPESDEGEATTEEDMSARDTADGPEFPEEDGIPTIQVNPDHSSQE